MSALAVVHTVATFDITAGEHPENVALGADGSIYVTLHQGAALWHQQPGGQRRYYRLPQPAPADTDVRFNGLVCTADARVFVAVRAADPATAGIWELQEDETLVRRVGLPAGAGLNGMASGERGDLYVADDTLGCIYHVNLTQRRASVWLADPRLAPQGTSAWGFPRYGANGLKLHAGALYVSNSSTGCLWRIPVRADGAPGALEAVHPHVVFHNIDDFAFDDQGRLYYTTVVDQTVERVREDGTVETLLTAAHGLDMPTAVVVGSNDPLTLYVTNGAFYSPPGHTARPSLMCVTYGRAP